MVVKIHTQRLFAEGKPFAYWPRLAPSPAPSEAARCEHAALTAIHSHFAALGDPAFGAVRALDFLPRDGTVVLEAAPSSSLQGLVLRSHRLAGTRRLRSTEQAFRNAGRWLRSFQQLQAPARGNDHRTRRQDLVAALRECSAFLAGRGEQPAFVARIADTAIDAAERLLPPDLPLGLYHGDFWPGNVLVGPGSRVAMIDTYAYWRAPQHEDLGYFLANLKAYGTQLYSQGRWCRAGAVEAFERAFLAGYFGTDAGDVGPVRLFEILTVLSKWGAAAHNLALAGPLDRPAKACKMVLRRRYSMRLLAGLAEELADRGPGTRLAN